MKFLFFFLREKSKDTNTKNQNQINSQKRLRNKKHTAPITQTETNVLVQEKNI